ncbi:MAG: hypothetical protein AAGG08_00615 [Actinomycetota bacterium]
MTTGLLVVIASTAALVVAAALVVSADGEHDHVALASTGRRSRDRAHDRESAIRAVWSVVTGGSVLVLSGWLLPAVVVGIVTWVAVGAWQRRQRFGGSDVERTDALASWIENLRDVLVAGDQPIGAIAATVPSCPPIIRPAVRRLATSLGHQDPEVAFRRFADDLDDPLADLVAAGLLVAVQRGARTVAVLSSLADQARSQADRRRVLDAERAPVQREVMLLTLIMAALLLGVLLFGRASYLSAYDTSGGQLFLAVVIAAYGLLLLRVQRLARFPRPGRFLTATGGGVQRGAEMQEQLR